MLMGFYNERVYPFLVQKLGNPKPIREIRKKIIPAARGTVLEIGIGSGANLEHYDEDRVEKLYALEPNPGMVRLAERVRQGIKLNPEYLQLPGERIPLNDATADTVVSTFTMCTIPDITRAIDGIRRVIRDD